MLPSNRVNNYSNKNNGFSTVVTIPVDILDNNDELPNLVSVQNLQLNQLPDGTFCLTDDSGCNVVNIINIEGDIEQFSNNTYVQNCGEYELQSRTIPVELKSPVTRKEQDPQNATLSKKEDCLIPNTFENEKYSCCKCDKIFNSLQQHQDHLHWHKYQKKFKCQICNVSYNVENNLKIHMVLIHADRSNKNNIQCPICKVKFQRQASMKSHLMVHQTEEYYTCDTCKNEYENENDYMKHIKSHLNEKSPSKKKEHLSLICSHCKLNFKDAKELRIHISEHAKARRLFVRPKKCNKPKVLVEKKFVCASCDKRFIKQSLLDRHWRIHSGVKPFQCQICERSFSQKSSLKIHSTKHTKEKSFACSLCPAKFSQKGNLRVHHEKTHMSEYEKTFRCPYCTCVFKRIASLNGHITKLHIRDKVSPENDVENVLQRLRELEKISLTPLVDKDSQRNTVAEVHQMDSDISASSSLVTLTENTSDGTLRKLLVKVKKIGDTRWFICSHCSKEFKKPSDLIRHIRIHTKEKPYKCELCKQSFSLKSTLISHINTHRTGKNDRRYKCTICDHRFVSLKALNLHIWKHNLDSFSKYQCTACGFLCDSPEDSEDHKKEHENSQEDYNFQLLADTLMESSLVQEKNGSCIKNFPKRKLQKTVSERDLKLFVCEICKAKFFDNVSLTKHLQIHTTDRKYVCVQCQKSYATFSKFKEHLNTHSNIKNYGCKFCNKKFGSLALMKRHLEFHNSIVYSCPYCSKIFKKNFLCRTHCSKVHGEDVLLQDIPRCIMGNTEDVSNLPPNNSELTVKKIASGSGISKKLSNTLNNGTSVIVSIGNHQKTDISSPSKQRLSENIVIQPLLTPMDSTQIVSFNENSSFDPNIQTVYFSLDDLQILGNPSVNVSSPLQSPLQLEHTSELFLNNDPDNSVPEPEILNGSVTAEVISPIISEEKAEENYKETDNNQDTSASVAISTEDRVINFVNLDNNIKVMDIFDGNSVIQNTSSVDAQHLFEDVNFICMNCSKLFCSFVLFQNHVCDNTKHSVGNFRIEDNTVEGKENSGESEQTKKTENTDNISYPLECRICKKVISNKVVHNKHMKIHSNNQNYICGICRKNINGRTCYIKHLKHSHSDSNGTVMCLCGYCSKEFKKPSDLARHLRIHTGEKPYKCKICDKKFSLKSTLESHERIHDSVTKRVTCPTCNSYFSSNASLKVHLTLHTGQKPYHCSYCDMKFRTIGHRNSHVFIKHISKNKKAPEKKQNKIKNILESVVAEVTSNVRKDVQPDTTDVAANVDDQILSVHQVELPIDTLESTVTAQHVTSIPKDQINLDTTSLLQQLQSTGMILTAATENDVVSSLILDDVTLLNFDPSKDNFQIIPIDSGIHLQNSSNGSKEKLNNIKKQECQICHKLYSSKDGLRRHIKKIHCKTKLLCENSNLKFNNEEQLRQHLEEHNQVLASELVNQGQTFYINVDKEQQYIIPSQGPSNTTSLNMKLELPSSNIEDSIFNNFFPLKRL